MKQIGKEKKKICRERESVKRKGVDGKKNGETLRGELLKCRERESR